jgi:hypothetical protein
MSKKILLIFGVPTRCSAVASGKGLDKMRGVAETQGVGYFGNTHPTLKQKPPGFFQTCLPENLKSRSPIDFTKTNL